MAMDMVSPWFGFLEKWWRVLSQMDGEGDKALLDLLWRGEGEAAGVAPVEGAPRFTLRAGG
jgi:hypothetical protein